MVHFDSERKHIWIKLKIGYLSARALDIHLVSVHNASFIINIILTRIYYHFNNSHVFIAFFMSKQTSARFVLWYVNACHDYCWYAFENLMLACCWIGVITGINICVDCDCIKWTYYLQLHLFMKSYLGNLCRKSCVTDLRINLLLSSCVRSYIWYLLSFWCLHTPLYNGYRVVAGCKAAGAWCWAPTSI